MVQMHPSAIQNIVLEGIVVPNTPAVFYGLGAAVGAVVCVIAWFAYDLWVRRTARNHSEDARLEAPGKPATTGATTTQEGAAAQKPRSKMAGRELIYLAGIWIGTEMIARGAKGAFPNFPADALVWGTLTGFVICLAVLFGLRNGLRRKSATGEEPGA
jgi:hypothetical protein